MNGHNGQKHRVGRRDFDSRETRDFITHATFRCVPTGQAGKLLRITYQTTLLTPFRYIHKSGYMESEQAILALAALAQPTRLDVFRLLVKGEPDGLAAGDIARALAVPQNTMSSHLSILSRAGLVTGQRFSRSIVYRADLAAFRAVMLFMVRDCCDGRPEICAPLIEDLAPCCGPARKKRSHARV